MSASLSRRRLLGAGAALAAAAAAGCAPRSGRRPAAIHVSPAAGTVESATPVPAIQTYAAEPVTRRVDHMELPLRLIVPRLEVDAPVVAVGLTAGLAMDVPQHPGDVGWYEYSARPGMKGNAVLAGHLDWYGVEGVFRRLADLRKGDVAAIQGAGGEERPYAVEWNREWPLVAAPIGMIFEPLDVPALTLITCGGRWNPATQRYDTRVVVRAVR